MPGKQLTYGGAMLSFASYGPYWRHMRKIATSELLSNQRLEFNKKVVATEIDTSVKELYGLWAKSSQNQVQVDMDKWFGDRAFNVILRMITGKRYFGTSGVSDESEGRSFRNAIIKWVYLAGVFPVSEVIPFLKWVDLQGLEREAKKTMRELDGLAENWV